MKTQLVVAGLIRRGTEILLVQQQGPNDPAPHWALPGGRVEEGELLTEALAREVREETGLKIIKVDRLIYSLQYLASPARSQLVAFVFEVTQWQGTLAIADPDQLILNAKFFAPEETLTRLAPLPWPAMREPMLAYLRGEAGPGTVWVCRQAADATDNLMIAVSAPPPAP